ncbi:MAG: tRNA pseudouridine(55) synthase TruB [Flavobacteriaceae bacterium]|jgi:tRNA pseudouridine55 synthase|nr:tRNA pseudouridine(55) synthase TruB [Flavobacteriaceae bacterium]
MDLSLDSIVEGQLLLMDKPIEWSSFQVVNKVRSALKRKYGLKKIKVGHAGTLDPLATGLLVLCTGKMTKKIQEIQGLEKMYTGTITLGATTPSYDLETPFDQHFPIDHITPEQLVSTRAQFVGAIAQYPPIFSAIKKEGKRLYEFARNGEKVEIQPRTVHIKSFELTQISPPTVNFEVCCSKGTYIRSLAHDYGKALESGGYLSALRRTSIGQYEVNNALSPDQFVQVLDGIS